jgi:uncharacterized LabA/DUF88 family protein
LVERVAAYVDGFNLYFGMRSKGWHRYYWLDIASLCRNLTLPHQTLVSAKYFTARIAAPPDKARRQNAFLEANEEVGRCELFFGQYQDTQRECKACGAVATVPQEKMTDLLIGLEMLSDAIDDIYDACLLVSGDSDLVAAVRKVREVRPKKKVIVAFPPERVSVLLRRAASAYFRIGRRRLAESQLPEEVAKADGYVLRRPSHWS